jgi:hypothetical protein
MEELIGDKNSFAIEFSVTDKKNFMGYAKLWLDGNLLGSPRDLIYFNGYLFNLLDQFCCSKILDENFHHTSIFQTYRLLKKYTYEIEDDIYNASRYSSTGSTFTDDYYIFSYLENGIINILWKVRKNAFFEDLKKMRQGLFHFSMKKSEFCLLVSEYKRYINSFNKE